MLYNNKLEGILLLLFFSLMDIFQLSIDTHNSVVYYDK